MSSVSFSGQSSTMDFAIGTLSYGRDLISRAFTSPNASKVDRTYLAVLGAMCLITGASAGAVGFGGYAPNLFSFHGRAIMHTGPGSSVFVGSPYTYEPPASFFPYKFEPTASSFGSVSNGTCAIP